MNGITFAPMTVKQSTNKNENRQIKEYQQNCKHHTTLHHFDGALDQSLRNINEGNISQKSFVNRSPIRPTQ